MPEPTIFVVDDDEAVRDSLKLLLEAHGWEVEVFASTDCFMARYRPRKRGCLILDQHLQGMKTGLQFLASEQRAALDLPVILITGRGDSDIEARAIEAGVAAYLDKPLDVNRLIDAIDQAIAAA